MDEEGARLMQSGKEEASSEKSGYGRRRLLGDGAWLLASQIAIALAGLLGVRLLTEYLEPGIYGQVGLWLGLTGLGYQMFCSPLSQAAFRFYPEVSSSQNLQGLRQLSSRLLLRSTSSLIGVILVYGVVYSLWKKQPFGLFVLLALLAIADVMQTFELGLLSAARRQKVVAAWQAIVAWARPLLAIVTVIGLGQSASSVLAGYLLATGGVLVVLWSVSFSFEGIHPKKPKVVSSVLPQTSSETSSHEVSNPSAENAAISPQVRGQIAAYAWPLVPLGLVGWVHSLGDRYIIEQLVGIEAAGLYIATYGLILKPYTMAEGVFQQTLLPAYNQAISAFQWQQQQRIFRIWLACVATTVALGCVCVYFLRDWVAYLLLAKAYRSTTPLMPWLGLGFACLAVAHVFEWRLYSLKQTRLVLLGQTIGAVASLIIAVPMIWYGGLLGAAMACPLYYAIYLLAMWGLSQKALALYQQEHTKFLQ